ncbi:hypothetical protein BH11ACT6_BH11ACT6_36280 [soil metagenome]
MTGHTPDPEHTRILRRAPSEFPTPPSGNPPEDTRTGIIRRTPTGSIPAQQPPDPRTTHIPAPPAAVPEDTRTGIIRRTPTGSLPVQRPPQPGRPPQPERPPQAERPPQPELRPEAPTGLIPEAPTGLIAPLPAPPTVEPEPVPASSVSAIVTCAVAILSGWAVSVVATDLITGWWQTDRLFCLGVGFLTFVFAFSTISGVITLLLRRAVGRYLIATGALVALLTFGAVFIAGAKIAWPVYLIPVLPVLSVVLAFLPGTGRWSRLR